MPGTDKALPENSQQNLNKKLDGAVEETFPSSDPVSVSITKGAAIEYDHDDDEAETLSTTPSKSGQQGTTESLLTQTKEKLSDVGSTVSKAAHEAYTEGSRYVGGAVGDGAVLPAKHGSSPTAGFRQPAVDTPRRPWAGLCRGLDDPPHRIWRRERHTRLCEDATGLHSVSRGLSLGWMFSRCWMTALAAGASAVPVLAQPNWRRRHSPSVIIHPPALPNLRDWPTSHLSGHS